MLKSLLTPIQNAHNSLAAFRTQKQYELSVTSQVIWLENMLNRYYDPLGNGIYIEDVGSVNQVYVANKTESPRPRYVYNKSEAAYKTYLYNKVENVWQFNFIVKVSALVYSNLQANNNTGLNSMRANLNKYKIFGSLYTIQQF